MERKVMRKSKIILTALLALILVAALVVTLIGCDIGGGGNSGGGGGGGTTPVTPDDPDEPDIPTPPTPPTPSGGGGTNPTDDTTGVKTEFVDQYYCIAQLIGSSKTSFQDGKYRCLNLYADIELMDSETKEVSKKRLIFRTNICMRYDPISFENEYEFTNYTSGATLYTLNEGVYTASTEYTKNTDYYYRQGRTSVYVKVSINSVED